MARILVVDDDPSVCDVFQTLLAIDGHQVKSALDGCVALAALREGPVDLAIVDLLMPEKEGFETIREVRREQPGVAVIAISGGSLVRDTDFLGMATKLGADRALHKPVRAQVLRTTVSECLAARRLRLVAGRDLERAETRPGQIETPRRHWHWSYSLG